jgi:acyl-CoA dehydrogenase family protein 9
VQELFNGLVPRGIRPMQEKYRPEEDEIVQTLGRSLRRFLAEHADSAAFDETKEIPASVLGGIADIGAFGLAVPEEYEGAGLNMEGFCHVLREVAAGDASVGVTVGAHGAIGTHGIKLFGTPEQKDRFLPDIATGKRIAAFAITEADAGSDLANVSTTAELSPDGKSFTLNGRKLFITNGGYGGTYTVLARTPGLARTADSTGLFVIQGGTPGFSTGPPEDKLGIRASSTTELIFEDVEVPRENLLGTGVNGLDLVKGVLHWGRMALAAGCWGAMRDITRTAARQAATRVQFGEPIARFGMVRRMLADIAAWTRTLEAMVTVTAKVYDNEPERAGMATSLTKIYASDRAFRATDHLVQIFGGMGYIRETGAERLLRDSRINKIYEGTNEIIKFLTALEGILSISSRVEGDASPGDLVRPGLEAPAAALTRSLTAFCEYALASRKKYGIRIRNRQLVLERIADMATAVYALFSLLVHAGHCIDRRGPERAGLETAAAVKTAVETEALVRRVLDEGTDARDAAVEAIADRALEDVS